jgi:aminoglycoside 3-N-acetyltransferase
MFPRRLIEPLLIVAEQSVRQVYFRSSSAQRIRASRAAPPIRRELRLSALRDALYEHGVRRGDTLMVHSGLSKINVVDNRTGGAGAPAATPPEGAAFVLETLRDVVGLEGTLVLPTFPKYPNEPDYLSKKNDGREVLRYDPATTPSKSGLMTEIFRTMPGVVRSRYPLQTISAIGPQAQWLVRSSVGPVRGLLHGPNSPYARLVEAKAWVVSLGIPLIDFCTVVHAAEDSRYDEWPVRDFWRERSFDIVDGERVARVVVLEREPQYSRGYAEELLRRDVRRHEVLSERTIGDVQCHGLRADRLYEMMMARNAGNTYPFMWPRVSRL